MEIVTKELAQKNWITNNIDNECLQMGYKTKGRGNSPIPLVLPRKIVLDETFMEAISLYIGDGKLSPDKYHLDFTSKDKDLVKFILDFFLNRFNININKIRFTLTYKRYSQNSINQCLSLLKLPALKLHLKQSDRHDQDCLGMQISSILLRDIFGKIVEKVFEYNFSNDVILRRAFLRGLFAAEGGIAINRRENYIVYIAYHLSLEKEENLAKLVTKLLEIERISSKEILRPDKGERYIQITGWDNYWKAYKIGMFDLNERKKKLFLNKCKKTRFYFKIDCDFKDELFKVNGLSQRQLAFKIGTSASNICVLRKEKDTYFRSKFLIELCRLKDISFEQIKEQIIAVRVNKDTLIEDREIIDFVFSEYLPEKLKNNKTWLP